jgi:RHS repeat-associated protein
VNEVAFFDHKRIVLAFLVPKIFPKFTLPSARKPMQAPKPNIAPPKNCPLQDSAVNGVPYQYCYYTAPMSRLPTSKPLAQRCFSADWSRPLARWGETLIEEKATRPGMHFESPYRFNAKELDEEPTNGSSRTPLKINNAREQTGLYYYGARYYNPMVSVWLGVDPLAGEFYTLTPYHFVANNPIIIIDPDGRDTLMMNRSRKLTSDERNEIFGHLEGIMNGRDLDVHVVSFSIIRNGEESSIGERMYMFSNPNSSMEGDNGLDNEFYTLSFEKMTVGNGPNRENDIRVTSFGVFIHPGKNTEDWKGCYGLSLKPDLFVSDNGYLTVRNTSVAQAEVRNLYNALNGGSDGGSLTGEKFLLQTNSISQETPINLRPKGIKNLQL